MIGLRAAGAICELARSRPRPPRHSALLVRSLRARLACFIDSRALIIPSGGEQVHALRSRERGCFLVVQTLWAEKIQSTTDAGSLNTFGRNEIEVAPISSALLRIACLVILYKTCRVPDQEQIPVPRLLRSRPSGVRGPVLLPP